jgi:uncharacterized SAM-binding protein YcdF (DUF218 family)
MEPFRRWRVIAVVSALLFTLVWPTSAPAKTTSELSTTAVRTRIIFFERASRPIDRALALNELATRSSFEAGLWNTFLASWDTANSAQKLNYTTPKGLPTKGHVFVVLGGSLTKSGKITTQLKNRLKVALAALAAYPKSRVLVSGGAPKNGHTEAAVMRAWLISNGIAASRITTEAKSSSTVGNAANSMTILKATSSVTSYTLISDASHIRRASVLFNAAALKLQLKAGKAWGIRQLANVAHKDKKITNPANDNTRAVISSNAAAVLGLSAAYSSLLSSPPKAAVLTALTVAPAKTTYQVGSSFRRTDLSATAVYDQGRLPVTNAVKISGFSSAKVGTEKLTVSYNDGTNSKAAAFTVAVVKATTTATVRASTKTAKKNHTRVTLTVKLASSTGIVPTGKVRIYVGSKLVKTVTIKTAAKGAFTYKLSRFTKTGTKKVKITFGGNAQLTSAKASVKLTVKR